MKIEWGGWFTAILLTLSSGAIWALAAFMSDGIAAWAAIPTALMARFSLSFLNVSSRIGKMFVSLVLYALTACYAQYLVVATSLAQLVGVDLKFAFIRTGFDLAFATWQVRALPQDVWLIFGGAILVVLLGLISTRGKKSSAIANPTV